MPEYLSAKVTQNITGLESFSAVSRLVASICVTLPLLSELTDAILQWFGGVLFWDGTLAVL